MQWIPVLAHIYSLPLRSEIKYLIITLHLSVAQYLSDMRRSTFLSARHNLAPLQKSRQNHRYVKTLALSGMIFRGGVRVIQCSVNVTRQGDLMPEVVKKLLKPWKLFIPSHKQNKKEPLVWKDFQTKERSFDIVSG